MNFSLKDSVLKVINTIENAGGEAYIVGGCVRDMMLNRTPGDFDVTTSLPPERILSLFEKTVATGLKHGTVTVIVDGDSIEVTTFRTDGKYNDSRHPESVNFVSDIKEDLARRDFTVNAIAYNPKSGITDLFGARADLNNKILKAVGDPEKRFKEDALRIMRLFRFACQLDFDLDKETLLSALALAHTLESISRERIAAELFKALLTPHPERLSPLSMTGALAFCGIEKGEALPEISALPPEREIRFYKFISDLKGDHVKVCKALKTDNALLNFCREVSEILENIPKNITECKKALKDYSEKAVISALILGEGDKNLPQWIIDSKEPYRIKDLALSGNDLAEMGYSGKALGEKLEALTLHVIEFPADNTKAKLKEILSE